MAAAKRHQQTTFAQVAIGGMFYTGIGFWIKKSESTAHYFGLSQRNNGRQTLPAEYVVFVEAVTKPTPSGIPPQSPNDAPIVVPKLKEKNYGRP